jgi:hypothetical protein
MRTWASCRRRVADFALLLTQVSKIEGIERIRYTTSHPLEFTQRLIDAYARLPKLVSQVHLPVQSGSDRILAAMKRNYTAMEYRSIIRRLRAARPGISISSDFIVGFPGETDADFEATLKLIDGRALRRRLQLHLQRASRHAGREPAGRDAARGEARAPAAAPGAVQEIAEEYSRRWSARASACWSRASRARTRWSSPGAPRTTAS